MERAKKIAIIVLLAFSIFICIESWKLGLGSFNAPGPGFLPFGAALTIISLSLLQFYRAWGKNLINRESAPLKGGTTKNVLYVLGGVFTFPLLLSSAGFLLCTFVFTGYCLKIIASHRWRVILLMSFGTTIVCHLVFNVLLAIQFPRGTWIDKLLAFGSAFWK